MTMFVNGSFGLPVTIHSRNDYSACDSLYFGKGSRAADQLPTADEGRGVSDNANDSFIYANKWWPRHGQILGGWGDGLEGDIFLSKSPRWKAPFTVRGANGRLAFVGYTRDQYGSVLGTCTVRLFRTVDDSLQSKVTSDANGLYFSTTPFNDSHYQVIHNAAGTLAGATRNDLLPS